MAINTSSARCVAAAWLWDLSDEFNYPEGFDVDFPKFAKRSRELQPYHKNIN